MKHDVFKLDMCVSVSVWVKQKTYFNTTKERLEVGTKFESGENAHKTFASGKYF